MGLKSTLQNAARKAISATGDIATKITYVKSVQGAFNVTTGLTDDTLTTYTNVPALLCRLSEDDMDWFPANLTGQKILIAYQDLPLESDDTDYVIIDGKRWNVHKRKEAPGFSLHIIYVHMPQAV